MCKEERTVKAKIKAHATHSAALADGKNGRAEDKKSVLTSECQRKRVLPKLKKGNLLTKF